MASPITQTLAKPVFPHPVGPPPARPLPLLLLPLLTAGLLYAGYFPLALGWTGWFALVPLLALVRRQQRHLYKAAWLGALVFYTASLQWMRVADPRMYATWILLALWCSIFVPLALAILRRLDRTTNLPLTYTVPLLWTALDYFRTYFIGGFASTLLGSYQHDAPGGFGWYFLGHTQHDFLEVIQIADLGGVFAVSFLLAAVNGLLFEVLFARTWFRAWFVGPDTPPRCSRLVLLGQGLTVFTLLLATLAYGTWRLGQGTGAPGPRLALIQGNVPQQVRNEASSDSEDRDKVCEEIVKDYDSLAHLALSSRPDLIVWPETSYPAVWVESEQGRPARASQELADEVARRYRTSVLLGVNAEVFDPEVMRVRPHNSAVLIGPDGRWRGRYDKVHRVPFGEYIPFHSWLPVLDFLAPYDHPYAVEPGRQFTRFPLTVGGKEYTFGVVICYEDTDASMARPYAGGDGLPAAAFVLNISNDGWFDGTAEHEEHLALCRFRAVECRRSVARSVNMGISALIDSSGRVLRPQPLTPPRGAPEQVRMAEIPAGDTERFPVSSWGSFKKVPAVLIVTVPIDTRTSLYARWGDWLPACCWLALLAGLLLPRFRRAGSARGEEPVS